jgi:carbon-monoxide dehydrogenase small subunit
VSHQNSPSAAVQTQVLRLTVNGEAAEALVEPRLSLLSFLRERLGLLATKRGCEEGECGACTVLLDDEPVDSCLVATATVEGRTVRTIESLSTGDELSPLQQSFLEHGAVQCGFCTPGFLMTLTALVENAPNPSPSEIREAISGNICRCTGYRQIIDAVVAAATPEVQP